MAKNPDRFHLEPKDGDFVQYLDKLGRGEITLPTTINPYAGSASDAAGAAEIEAIREAARRAGAAVPDTRWGRRPTVSTSDQAGVLIEAAKKKETQTQSRRSVLDELKGATRRIEPTVKAPVPSGRVKKSVPVDPLFLRFLGCVVLMGAVLWALTDQDDPEFSVFLGFVAINMLLISFKLEKVEDGEA